MSLWSRIISCTFRGASADPQVQLKDDGFDLVAAASGVVSASVRWDDVRRIQAYKLDLVTTDCICLLFELGPGSASVQVSEEWLGFQELFGPLVRRFPEIPASWYVDIMTPPFEAKRTILFTASDQPSGNLNGPPQT